VKVKLKKNKVKKYKQILNRFSKLMKKSFLFDRFDMIRHFWISKFIRDDEVFKFLKCLYDGKDPFRELKFLQMIAKNIIENRHYYHRDDNKTNIIRTDLINPGLFNLVFSYVHNELQFALDEYKEDYCEWCGSKGTSYTFIANSDKFKIFEDNEKFTIKLIRGRVYWLFRCGGCGRFYVHDYQLTFGDLVQGSFKKWDEVGHISIIKSGIIAWKEFRKSVLAAFTFDKKFPILRHDAQIHVNGKEFSRIGCWCNDSIAGFLHCKKCGSLTSIPTLWMNHRALCKSCSECGRDEAITILKSYQSKKGYNTPVEKINGCWYVKAYGV
jgi:hypothetical protein